MALVSNRAIVTHPYAALSFSQYLQQQALVISEKNEILSADSSSSNKTALPSMVFIGAEGGWIDYEIELLATQGCQAVHIGQRILRTEAAVNVILGQWLL